MNFISMFSVAVKLVVLSVRHDSALFHLRFENGIGKIQNLIGGTEIFRKKDFLFIRLVFGGIFLASVYKIFEYRRVGASESIYALLYVPDDKTVVTL